MRTPLMATLSVTALLLAASAAFAAPVELTCKENRNDKNPLHVIVDEEAGTITLGDDRHPAQFTDTQVVWEESPYYGGGDNWYEAHTKGTLDRETGLLKAHADPYTSHRKFSRSGGAYSVTCVKAEKPS